MRPDRTTLAGLSIPRLLTGLWQVADQEKDGTPTDIPAAAAQLSAYARAGFDAFDMADHYGSAELIAGEMLRRWDGPDRPLAFTKWCPAPGPMTPEVVRAGVRERLDRLGVARVDLLQFHWWSFEHPAWLDALREIEALRQEGLVGAIGVTNFDAAHLALALSDGIPIASNQVSFSLIDRRAAGPLTTLCRERGVRLLAYGTLCGGLLSERWLDKPRPEAVRDWSKMKYLRFVDAAGGWEALQAILRATDRVARRHGASISNVATRWVLDHDSVAAAIVGARLGESEHRADNLALFDLRLDDEDHAMLSEAFAATRPIPGDCGDEYRQPPFLTASGDLSHHLAEIPSAMSVVPDPDRPGRARAFSGSEWEPLAGYCRAVRDRDRILVSGTTATHGRDRVVAPSDAGAQTTYILDKIAAAVRALGGRPEDILRTRLYLREATDVDAAARAHGRCFATSPPANTTFVVGDLIGDFRVEIEAEAVLS
ncbi:aldo/keto reductase family [Rubellimicrobium mesophilum DSM 19309]|uniref:Aldo/keto reductase family n=1 Tax=Rubellimicrobium mesophilum DSM 19309 TaxID=442562 RepID=A0A017HNW6_9RHOB|nr:aldo/keto reductase [Rubellimicrobium mesophilum]EYD76031.1 aldo/keto reductase family [Rubellimicrobium mesophilum DSM 19309]